MTRLWARRCRVQIPTRATDFSPKSPVRLCGPPSLLLNGHRGSFPVTKKPGREDNSSTSCAQVKNGWRCNSFFTLHSFVAYTGKTLPLYALINLPITIRISPQYLENINSLYLLFLSHYVLNNSNLKIFFYSVRCT